MSSDRELSALIFELQRAASPVDRARALARAWRTIRKLSATERRLLAREIGIDGAEELVEGLAGKSGGVFAPAAILEALGAMRRDESLTIKGLIRDLKDPAKRDDLLTRGVDLVAGAVDDELESPPKPRPPLPTDAVPEAEFHEMPVGSAVGVEDAPNEERVETLETDGDEPRPLGGVDAVSEPETRLLEADDVRSEPEPEDEPSLPAPPVVEPEPEPEPAPRPEAPSIWDVMWEEPAEPPMSVAVSRAVDELTGRTPLSNAAVASVLERLRSFRNGLDRMQGAPITEITTALERLPETWARRRAVVALIESGVVDDTGRTLDLIESLDRPMDRRWCLAALARYGGLSGSHLERALGMLTSPAARRRVRRLARR